MDEVKQYVGIDVAKAQLDVFIRRLDAEVLARCGEVVRPTPRPLSDAQGQV